MKKKGNSIIIIITIISFLVGISFLIYLLNYFNIQSIVARNVIIIILIFIAILYIPYKIGKDKEQLVNEIFILDISSKSNNAEHIRITEKNMLFKYKGVIRYYYIFPKFFSSTSLKGKLWETPTYMISNKIQLLDNELNKIIEEINNLNSNENEDIIVNYKGNKKLVNCKDINNIFTNYLIKIG